jgi:hypothetical protein
MPIRPTLMSEERVNWYLRQLDNPAFRMGLVRDGVREPVKEKLILSLNFYKIPIPDELRQPLII